MCEYIILEDFFMSKYIFDNAMGFTVSKMEAIVFTLLSEEQKPIGLWDNDICVT